MQPEPRVTGLSRTGFPVASRVLFFAAVWPTALTMRGEIGWIAG